MKMEKFNYNLIDTVDSFNSIKNTIQKVSFLYENISFLSTENTDDCCIITVQKENSLLYEIIEDEFVLLRDELDQLEKLLLTLNSYLNK